MYLLGATVPDRNWVQFETLNRSNLGLQHTGEAKMTRGIQPRAC
jgi:hypothetical protein